MIQNRKMPSKNAIFKRWEDELSLGGMGCFACGWEGILQRCHILPKCEGGNDSVENIHLLCLKCHKNSEYLSGDEYWTWFNEVSAMPMERVLEARVTEVGKTKAMKILSGLSIPKEELEKEIDDIIQGKKKNTMSFHTYYREKKAREEMEVLRVKLNLN